MTTILQRWYFLYTPLNYSDLDQTCDIFNSIVKTVAEKYAVFVNHKIKGKIEAWGTNDFL